MSLPFFIICSNIHAQTDIPVSVISSGGMNYSGTTYNLSCTIGQPAIGVSFNSGKILGHGFWYSAGGNLTYVTPVENNLPEKFALGQNFPNPFNLSTTIRISVPEQTDVSIKLYDILGAEVLTIFAGELNPGYYDLNFDAGNLASGIYIYRMTAGSFVESRKMNLLK